MKIENSLREIKKSVKETGKKTQRKWKKVTGKLWENWDAIDW